MKEIVLDASGWRQPKDFYRDLLPLLEAPEWHGDNLDALYDSISSDTINAVRLPYRIVIANSEKSADLVRSYLGKVGVLFADLQARGIKVEFAKT